MKVWQWVLIGVAVLILIVLLWGTGPGSIISPSCEASGGFCYEECPEFHESYGEAECSDSGKVCCYPVYSD